MKISRICLTILILVTSSCKDNSISSRSSAKGELNQSEIEVVGIYQALFKGLNNIVPDLRGSLTVVREEDEFIADLRLSRGPRNTLITQSIHEGQRCPELSDDLNQDGFIDGEESFIAIKRIIIPLDDDLQSQRMGSGLYPVTDQNGNYFWSRLSSFSRMLEDLKEVDLNPHDDILKIDTSENLKLLNKVVILRGAPNNLPLPDTVMGHGKLNSHQSLPIACGILKKIKKIPGRTENVVIHIPSEIEEREDDNADFSNEETSGNYSEN